MKGYKGFEKGLICRGKQYAENTVFEEEKAEICNSGFHFCKHPFDVFEYYPPCDNGKFNEYAEVEALDECLTDDGRKFCTKKLKIGNKVTFDEFISAGVEFNLSLSKNKVQNTSTGIYSGASATGNRSGASATGNYSGASATGDYSGASATGYRSGASATGYRSGAMVVGNFGKSEVKNNSVAVVIGKNGKAKGDKGSFIVLTEMAENENGEKYIKSVKSHKVDGKNIKADVFYTLENGKFVEAE